MQTKMTTRVHKVKNKTINITSLIKRYINNIFDKYVIEIYYSNRKNAIFQIILRKYNLKLYTLRKFVLKLKF